MDLLRMYGKGVFAKNKVVRIYNHAPGQIETETENVTERDAWSERGLRRRLACRSDDC